MRASSIDARPMSALTSRASGSQDATSVTAYGVLERGRYSWVWIVATCPYCGKQHDHYGGPLDGDPWKYIGQICIARCDKHERRRFSRGAAMANLRYVLKDAQFNEPIIVETVLPPLPLGYSVFGRKR